MKRVVIESPFAARHPDGSWDAAGVARNIRYVRACMADSFARGEAPYASHALYTLDGVLNDQVPSERAAGIDAGFRWAEVCHVRAFYVDLGWSSGMRSGLEDARAEGQQIEQRRLHADALDKVLGGR